jgi:hypothetical protein
MSFKHLKMFNAASKCLKIPLTLVKVVKFMLWVNPQSPHCMKP